MEFTPDQLAKVEELRIRASATINTLRQTAATLRLAAINEARNGETHCATVLYDIALGLEDTANGGR